jgi:hypothetical protein
LQFALRACIVTPMDRQPEDTKEPPFRLFRDDISLEEIAFKRTKLDPEKATKREKLFEAYLEAFELVGGIPRLALEMDRNHLGYLAQMIRLSPKETDIKHSGEIILRPALPPSALDDPIDVTPTGIPAGTGSLAPPDDASTPLSRIGPIGHSDFVGVAGDQERSEGNV